MLKKQESILKYITKSYLWCSIQCGGVDERGRIEVFKVFQTIGRNVKARKFKSRYTKPQLYETR